MISLDELMEYAKDRKAKLLPYTKTAFLKTIDSKRRETAKRLIVGRLKELDYLLGRINAVKSRKEKLKR